MRKIILKNRKNVAFLSLSEYNLYSDIIYVEKSSHIAHENIEKKEKRI